MRWPNIQCIPTPAQWIITAREWHGASDSHTVGALGLTGAAFAQIVLPGQPAREDAEQVAALGLTSAAFTKVVFNANRPPRWRRPSPRSA
jgi:hypothetical protein